MSEEYPPLPDWVQAIELVGPRKVDFESIVEEEVYEPTLLAGTNRLEGILVPEGKIWKITQAVMYYIGTVTDVMMQLSAMGLAEELMLLSEKPINSEEWYIWSGEIYLQEEDYMRLIIFDATASDTASLYYAGVQMNVP